MKRVWVVVDPTMNEMSNAYLLAFTRKGDAEQYRCEENEMWGHNYGEPVEFVPKEKR